MNRDPANVVAPPVQTRKTSKTGSRLPSPSVPDSTDVLATNAPAARDLETQIFGATRISPKRPTLKGGSTSAEHEVNVAATAAVEVASTFAERHSSWMLSFCVHACSMIILALIVIPNQEQGSIALDMTLASQDDGLLEMDAFELDSELETLPDDLTDPVAEPDFNIETAKLDIEIPDPFAEQPNAIAESLHQERLFAGDAFSEPATPLVTGTAGGVAGRSSRRNSALQLGATKESEEAVDRALRWLVAHQENDGSWQFDLRRGPCNGRCRHAGLGRASNGATAIALLPFLGAGQTHEKGYHRGKVKRGLEFLIQNQNGDGSFLDNSGNMYSHGLATLVLCEAIAMSESDPSSSPRGKFLLRLKKAAQKAVQYSVKVQHPGGGWRYAPHMRGDTSVLGWQAMALRSAVMADLNVPERTLMGISKYLNSVSGDTYGATYGYISPSPRDTMTAVGLLCRMYEGWGRQHPGIANGVEHLSGIGPSVNNMYYNYYATQVVHHYGGPDWERWNEKLRDHLVQTQAKDNHESGSWFFRGDHGSTIGGRLYITAMATMILEVYYRHMPIYSKSAIAGAQL